MRAPTPPPGSTPLLPNSVLGTLIFVVAEVMMFAGLVSAFVIVRSSAPEWPPPDQPRLPVAATAVNTAALLASGALLVAAGRAFRRGRRNARGLLLASLLLGACFVLFQGVEWMRLLRQGLTLTSSTHGSFFYLIVGMHALHALAALIVLAYVWMRLVEHKLRSSTLAAAEIFWYFVVGVWPILYLRVYL